MAKHYLAVDLGASSGRTIIGTLDQGTLKVEEITRFWNGPTEIDGTLYWDFVHLFRNICEGVSKAKSIYGDDLVSMGVCTWGVDFGLLDGDGKLLENPVNYRDSRTAGMFDEVFKRVPRETVFAHTGIQFMELNTLYQLMSLSLEDGCRYQNADTLLFSPDLLMYWLTGKKVAERTIASTSQFYNPVTGTWATELLEQLGIRTDLFAELVDPGTVVGSFNDLPVVAVGGHDTASAFASVPAPSEGQNAFLSSGTWSLLGMERKEALINDEVLAAGFTNEVGVCGTIRFLKNLSGLWILQELRREWKAQGHDYSWRDLEDMADTAPAFHYVIDPADPCFIAPGDMTARIRDYCERTGQAAPESEAEMVRAVYEGLALLYADTCQLLEELTNQPIDTLCLVGGGSKDALLNQCTANATGKTVQAGPCEATAIGNLLVQMLAMGDIDSLQEGRDLVRSSFSDEICTFSPTDDREWKSALEKWRKICRS